jgi:hypothetical protein
MRTLAATAERGTRVAVFEESARAIAAAVAAAATARQETISAQRDADTRSAAFSAAQIEWTQDKAHAVERLRAAEVDRDAAVERERGLEVRGASTQ